MGTSRKVDGETAYSVRPGTYIKELTEVGRGTPMGELLRRSWHPVRLTTRATSTPREAGPRLSPGSMPGGWS